MRITLLCVLAAAATLALFEGSAAGSGPAAFLTGPSAGKPLAIARAYLKAHTRDLGLTASDLSDLAVTDRYTDSTTGTTHIYFQQRHKGIGVYNGITGVHVARDGSVINVANRFVANLSSAVNAHAPARAAKQGVKDVARALGLDLKREPAVVRTLGGAPQTTLFYRMGISLDAIPAKLVYVPTASGARLAWNVTVAETSGRHWWSANVDASSGALLSKTDYVANETYNAFAPPRESPAEGGRSLLADPADATASPFGWLDTDGAAGADSTLTIGNNVHAYTDVDHNDLPDPGSEADGGAGLLFDFPLDLGQEPSAYRPAAVTNLFFWNNYVHDVSYHYGFTEAAGNFQENNYGKGGLGGDSVLAEAQDGGGLGNSNFGVPPDGAPPRMQMFLWPQGSTATLTIGAPAAIAGNYAAVAGDFGTGHVSGTVAGPTGASTGCLASDFTGFSGAIALLDRGDCTFSIKIRNAQDAGASAAVVANNTSDPPFAMPQGPSPGGQPTIPAVMVSQTDGNTFKANLATLDATVDVAAQPDRDGDLDNTIIAHEYTHGISNRLTGGPSTTSCLDNAEQGGEGWSDFVALVLTAKAGQTGATPRDVGTYVFPGGLRDFPYTTDSSINPQTYDTIKADLGAHFVGEVWAETLWEVYWSLVGQYGFNANLLAAYWQGGNNLALQLVMDGLKLQPCNPGFVDARDAILLADQNLTGGANQCLLWTAFAKRGLGSNAVQGSSASATDGTQDFTVPAAPCGFVTYEFSGFFGGVKDPPTLNAAKTGKNISLVFSLHGNFGLDVFANGYPKSQQVDCKTKAAIGSADATSTPAGKSLKYDKRPDRYTYPWQTSKSYAKTCRQFILQLNDSSTPHTVYFKFS